MLKRIKTTLKAIYKRNTHTLTYTHYTSNCFKAAACSVYHKSKEQQNIPGGLATNKVMHQV